jgi:hypothetical protein
VNINVGCWFKTTGATGSLICSDTGSTPNRALQFKVATTHIQFNLASAGTVHTVTGAAVVNDGFWHHAVGTYDGTTMRLYVDGVADGTLTTGVTTTLASKSARIGAQIAGVTQQFFTGSIAEAFIRYSVITTTEIAQLVGGITADRLAVDHYWPLLGISSPEPDIGVGTATNGTLTGTTSVAGPPEVNRSLFIPSLGRRPVPMTRGPDKDTLLGMRGNSY